MTLKKNYIIVGGSFLIAAVVLVFVWFKWFAPTRIAFVNYQVINLGEISKANDNSFIKIREVTTEELDKLPRYDMVFINAMGMRITEEQRERLKRYAEKGLPVLTTWATNPANKIISVDSIQADSIRQYLLNGGRRNYRSALNYVRKHIDGKITFIKEPEALVKRPDELLYHLDPDKPEDEEIGFNHVSEYNGFLEKHHLYSATAPRIIITGVMGEPKDLIKKLEETGNVVYPVRNFRTLVDKHQIDSIQPSAVIYMAHGRLGDYAVRYLEKRNIPLFNPLNVNRLVEDWEEDKMGMSGGFLSQSIVTPEIDGAVRPFALFGHYKDEEGLRHAFAMPERLDSYVKTINSYISLRHKPNRDKRIAIYYYKGPGQNALTAAGMEVGPSLYNLLSRMKQEGYRVDHLPSSSKELERMIQEQGAVFGSYAEGTSARFVKTADPAIVRKEEYEQWANEALRHEKQAEVVAKYGEFPGDYMSVDGTLAIPRLAFGNVVLLPQNAAGKGDNEFKVVHGVDAAPPYPYIASYLWTQYGFKADALIHFGTHGSLEFTPKKQVALSSKDWPDRLVGTLPHFYIYTIGNVGEGLIAKRRSYAGLQSYLTPPFLESSVRSTYHELMEKIKIYNQLVEAAAKEHANTRKLEAETEKASIAVKSLTVKMGIHRDLELDSLLADPYSEEDISRIENFAEELATEKITGQLYTMGVPYEEARITSSIYAMCTDPIAYSVLALDKLRHRVDEKFEKHAIAFTQRYLNPARTLIAGLLANRTTNPEESVCRIANISPEELAKAHEINDSKSKPVDMMAMMANAGNGPNKRNGNAATEGAHKRQHASDSPKGGHGSAPIDTAMAKMAGKMTEKKKTYSKEEINFAMAVMEIERTVQNVNRYKKELTESPYRELASMINALNGGYTLPSPGGDPIVNPNTLPTGRNLYGINAEATPSESAWEKGKMLADNTIEMYRRRHHDSIPRKVSYTLWSGEFIETGGATIAQVLYMLGVEPIRDTFGRVTDLKLIPSKELGRPRIDVVVQTSGQLRDLAASRLFLINKAVEMAAEAKYDEYENLVADGVVETERTLIEKGITPKDAREISTYRVFGGLNGGYGTGIQAMVMSGDRWQTEREIADTYLHNMGAYYGSEKNWEVFRTYAFEAALTRTDAVVQPRQSNTWGALSLDHVYEFMGGLNLAVRNVTGKDPDAYLSDYRNRNRFKMQEVKEAISVESRTTLFNPTYIKEKMKGGAGGAGTFAEIVQNTYGWNVMKPKAIDKEMWDRIFEVYVKDEFDLGIRPYFEQQNPAALEEITAVMLETVRKGMWKASEEQIAEIVKMHTDLVNRFKPSCSRFVCDNAELRKFIASKTDAETAVRYNRNIRDVRSAASADKKDIVMKKEELSSAKEHVNKLSNTLVGISVLTLILALILFIRYKRKHLR